MTGTHAYISMCSGHDILLCLMQLIAQQETCTYVHVQAYARRLFGGCNMHCDTGNRACDGLHLCVLTVGDRACVCTRIRSEDFDPLREHLEELERAAARSDLREPADSDRDEDRQQRRQPPPDRTTSTSAAVAAAGTQTRLSSAAAGTAALPPPGAAGKLKSGAGTAAGAESGARAGVGTGARGADTHTHTGAAVDGHGDH